MCRRRRFDGPPSDPPGGLSGEEHYGPLRAPLDVPRDMSQEAIEELLDVIYYLTRQVVRLEYLRGKLRRMGRRKVWSFASD